MAKRLRIEGREQFAVNIDGNPMPVYIEDEPDPKPKNYVSIMICPDCDNGILIKGGPGEGGSVHYRCSNCDLSWARKLRMEQDIVIEMG